MRITESQLRRIIRQEAGALREGPGRKGRKARMDSQTGVDVDGALSMWRRLSDVTDARQRLKQAESMAKGITSAQVGAALDEAIATMQGLGMASAEITDYLYKRVEEMEFSESGAADITRAVYERLGAGSSGY